MIRKCLFPAAGYGTRFLPATKAMPKEMLPVMAKPLIQYGVEEAVEAGINVMAIITGRGKRAIEDHFDISYELEHQIKGSSKEHLLDDIRDLIANCSFTYTRQIDMRGLGDAIYKGRVLIGNEPFAVLLADDLCTSEGPGVLSQMTEIYRKYRCSIVAVQEVPEDQVSKYGVISGKAIADDLYMIDEMVEKPAIEEAPSNLAIIGRYILTPDIFELIENTRPGKGGEIQITDALMSQVERGMVLAYRIKGPRYDSGSIDGFVEATNYINEKEHI
jgi:UTP--glucose-1-phosphate uridylyltransferase